MLNVLVLACVSCGGLWGYSCSLFSGFFQSGSGNFRLYYFNVIVAFGLCLDLRFIVSVRSLVTRNQGSLTSFIV